MFFNVKDDYEKEISIDEINKEDDQIIAGYLTLDEFTQCYSEFGFLEANVEECKIDRESIRSTIEVFDKYSFGIVTVIEPTAVGGEMDKVAFFVKRDLFLIVKIQDDNGSTIENFMAAKEKYKQNVTLEKLIYAYFERLIYGDNRILESIGKRITELEESMLNDNTSVTINKEIFGFKKELLMFKDYYEQLIDIGEELEENGNNIFAECDLRYFRLFTNKTERLSRYTESLAEMTVHLREAYEASIDLNLNNIMKIFTVITTIFLPLTLVTGWYGMNFEKMPELAWRFGYPAIIFVSILIITISIFYFKKKKFL